MRFLLAVVLAFALAGCATTVSEPTPAPAPSLPLPAAAPAPVTLSFPAAGLDGVPLSPTGLDDKGALEVPPLTDPGRVVWLRWSQRMATSRPLVLAAHVSGRNVDGAATEGAFFRLGEAIPGDVVTVRDAAGHLTVYIVRSVKQYPKTEFPTEVYAPQPGPRVLLLVTCSGQLVDRSYTENTIVRAEATS